MSMETTRRQFVAGALTGTIGFELLGSSTFAQTPIVAESAESGAPSSFPRQSADLVQEVVGASHGRFDRVRELVTAYPELAKSSVDWSFGDWESPIEAASHTGQREIAVFLMEHGARPNLFTHAMFGELDVVRAILTVRPDLRKTPGPHGLSLMHHARVGEERAAPVVEYLQSLGGADEKTPPASKGLADAIVGDYAVPSRPGLNLTVEDAKQGLVIRGKNGIPRILFELPDGSLHPAGAPSVRFRFQIADGKAKTVEVAMGAERFTAQKM